MRSEKYIFNCIGQIGICLVLTAALKELGLVILYIATIFSVIFVFSSIVVILFFSFYIRWPPNSYLDGQHEFNIRDLQAKVLIRSPIKVNQVYVFLLSKVMRELGSPINTKAISMWTKLSSAIFTAAATSLNLVK